MKLIKQDELNDILCPYLEDKISYLKVSEVLNSRADEYAIGFAEWVNENAYKFPTKTTTKELLEIYKNQLSL